MSYLKLKKAISDLHEGDKKIIEKAYNFALKKHQGQKRLSGEDYIVHPISVAIILAELSLDAETIAAALLHDVVEDTNTSLDDINASFGSQIANLVDGVTTLGTIDFSKLPSEDVQEAKFKSMIESLRKFFLAMANDIRVVIIKLADRLHNMRTLDALSKPNQLRISRETLEIFAPLADRLGMGSIKAELEDLSFKYINPKEYQKITELLQSGQKQRQHHLRKMTKVINDNLLAAKIDSKIDGRVKHLYSIYKKLTKVNGDISKIYDILAIRVIVEEVSDCYKALGIIHQNFKPLIYRIKDYISVPKPNGYQSLHTTVFGLEGIISEIQIRTHKMHEEAEYGVAAHWHYGETKEDAAYIGKTSFAPSSKLDWVNQLSTRQENINDDKELTETLNFDFFSDRIFVYSPRGEVINLPERATPVDFAYEIHSEIGRRCRGAKVNNQIVNLDTELKNRDLVEIILAPKNDKSGPPRGWLDFVVTAKAKQHIRSWYRHLRKEDNIVEGRRLLSEELSIFSLTEKDISLEMTKEVLGLAGLNTWDDILSSVGDGTITARQVVKKIFGQKLYMELDEKRLISKLTEVKTEENSANSLDGVPIRYAECCRPKKGDSVKGFITRGHGITIHRADCRNLLTSSPDRIMPIDIDINNQIEVDIEIVAQNRVGLIRDITAVISSSNVNIETFSDKKNESGESLLFVKLSLSNPIQLSEVIPKLNSINGVKSVKQG